MEQDLYQILGVSRGASQKEIQKAYRDLARRHHPDMNPDDRQAKEKFQRVQHAYDVLSNSEKRELYDRYGDAFETMGAGGGAGPWRRATSGGGPQEFDSVQFEQMFGGGGKGQEFNGSFADLLRQFTGGAARPQRAANSGRSPAGKNVRHEATIPFTTAILGGEVQLALTRAGGKHEMLTVKIPAGIEDGEKLRLRGKGEPGAQPGSAGDLLLTVRVAPHPYFQRRDNHLEVRVPVTLAEAALGAKIDVPSPRGTVTLTLPPGTSSGRRLRAKGLGVHRSGKPAGDLLAEIQIMLPEQLDQQQLELFRRLESNYSAPPRAELRW
ncbi:MAG: J domain-containing protein [Pirellulaceae bacterium]|nr:J domain-containing protein [Pirellulaceae bacterium]